MRPLLDRHSLLLLPLLAGCLETKLSTVKVGTTASLLCKDEDDDGFCDDGKWKGFGGSVVINGPEGDDFYPIPYLLADDLGVSLDGGPLTGLALPMPGDEDERGRVVVLSRLPEGTADWAEVRDEVTAVGIIGGRPGDRFGTCLAGFDGQLLVGAPGVDVATDTDAGTVYAFSDLDGAEGSDLGPGAGEAWTAPDASLDAAFGFAIAGFGGGAYVAMSAPGDAGAITITSKEGKAIVLESRSGTTAAGVVMAGGTDLLIGLPGIDTVCLLDANKLEGLEGTVGLEDTAACVAGDKGFGTAVAIGSAREGEVLAVGASGAADGAGAAWHTTTAAWYAGAEGGKPLDDWSFRVTGDVAGDRLGASVAIGARGDLIVGAPGANDGSGVVAVLYSAESSELYDELRKAAGADDSTDDSTDDTAVPYPFEADEWMTGEAGEGLGVAILAGRDIDGDGIEDAAIIGSAGTLTWTRGAEPEAFVLEETAETTDTAAE